MKTTPAIGFDLRPSRLLVVATVLAALLAMLALTISAVAGWPRVLLMAFVVVYVAMTMVRRWRPRVRSLLWRADGSVELGLRRGAPEDGREVLGAVSAARVMGPLIVLTLRWPPRERVQLWLLPDNLDPDTRRRLRMRLGAIGQHRASGNADNG